MLKFLAVKFYFISPLNEVSNLVLKLLAGMFCPNININLVTAASVDISFPDMIPIFR